MDEVRNADTLCIRVAEAHVGIIAADGAHWSGFWFGWADDFADEFDSFDTFKTDSDDWTCKHVVQVVTESLFATTSDEFADFFVVFFIEFGVWGDHFNTDDFKTDAFEALDDFADDATLDGVRFAENESSLD